MRILVIYLVSAMSIVAGCKDVQHTADNKYINSDTLYLDTLLNKSASVENFKYRTKSACSFLSLVELDDKGNEVECFENFHMDYNSKMNKVNVKFVYKDFSYTIYSRYGDSRYLVLSHPNCRIIYDDKYKCSFAFTRISDFENYSINNINCIYFLDDKLLPKFALKRNPHNDSIVFEKYNYRKESNDFIGDKIEFNNSDLFLFNQINYPDLLGLNNRYDLKEYEYKTQICFSNANDYRFIPIWIDKVFSRPFDHCY